MQIGLELLALTPDTAEIREIQALVRHGFRDILGDPTVTSLFPVVRHAEGDELVYENVALGYAVRFPVAWQVLDDQPASAALGGSRLVLRAEDSVFVYVEARVGDRRAVEPASANGRTVRVKRFEKNDVALMIALDAPDPHLARIEPAYDRLVASAELIGLGLVLDAHSVRD